MDNIRVIYFDNNNILNVGYMTPDRQWTRE